MKRKMRWLVVLLFSLSIAAYASGSSEEVVKGKPTVITFGSHQSGLPSSGIVQEIAKSYEEETGIKIDFHHLEESGVTPLQRSGETDFQTVRHRQDRWTESANFYCGFSGEIKKYNDKELL